MRVLFLSLALLLPTAGLAETFRCTARDGRITYSDAPCPSGYEGESIELIDNELDYSGWRSRHDRSHPYRRSGTGRSGREGHSPRSAPESLDCRQAKRHLRLQESMSIDRDPERIRAARVRVDLACDRDQPIDFRCRTALRNYEVEASKRDRRTAKSVKAAAEAACR